MDNLWLVYSLEHNAYWPQSLSGYVPLSKAGKFSFEMAKSIVEQGNHGMGRNRPQEAMLPVPHPAIMERAE